MSTWDPEAPERSSEFRPLSPAAGFKDNVARARIVHRIRDRGDRPEFAVRFLAMVRVPPRPRGYGHLRFCMTIQATSPTTTTSRMGTQTPP